MKKEIKIVAIILCICLGAVLGIVCYNKMNKSSYALNLPSADSVNSIIIKQNDKNVDLSDEEIIKDIINVLGAVKRTTKEESIQDSPTNVDNEIQVDFKFKNNETTKDGTSTIFVYEKKGKYYIEQPYNGIYRISADEYNSVEKHLK